MYEALAEVKQDLCSPQAAVPSPSAPETCFGLGSHFGEE
jgi:hypothetical protein